MNKLGLHNTFPIVQRKKWVGLHFQAFSPPIFTKHHNVLGTVLGAGIPLGVNLFQYVPAAQAWKHRELITGEVLGYQIWQIKIWDTSLNLSLL